MNEIESVYGKPGQKEKVCVPLGVHVRCFGQPPVNSLTADELKWNLINAENETYRLHEIVRAFTQLVDMDTPWPPGIGYWDGITRRQNEEEAERRRRARV